MNLKVLIVTATSDEADSVRNIEGIVHLKEGFGIGGCIVQLLVAGVGSVSTAWAMKQWISMHSPPDLALNAGIAGSYSDNIVPGDVVMPVYDCFADLGVETPDGYLTLSEAGLSDPDRFPFSAGWIISANRFTDTAVNYFKPVRAITVNTGTGTEATIKRLSEKYNPDIETMEGASFFYICAMEKIPFLSLRAISNKVEPRNPKKWDIPLALDKLSSGLKELLLKLE